MKVLLSGILGAILGTTIWLGAEHLLHKNFGWLVCLVGIFTGLAIKLSSQQKFGPGFQRGALAIVLTLAMIVGGRQLYAKLMQASLTTTGAAETAITGTAATDGSSGDNAGQQSTAASSDTQKIEVLDRPAPDALKNASRTIPVKKSFSQWDTLWISLAALAAYVISQKNSSDTVGTTKASDSNDENQGQDEG